MNRSERRAFDAALATLDRATIVAYLRRWGEEPHPDERIFWASIHKARLAIPALGEAAHEVSRQWLAEHGFRPEGVGA